MFKFKSLESLCLRITDGSHYSPKAINTGFPMLSVKDMRENGFDYSDCKFIDYKVYTALVKSDCKPLKNDILIAKDGSYLKHVFVVKEEVDQAILSSIGILRPNLELVNPEYIKYYLHSDFVKKEVAKKYVSGSALPRIILKNFGRIEVPYIDLEEQNKIAAVLSALDAKIEVNNRINAELEAMAKTLYDYWFVQFDFPDANGKPYKTSGGNMVYNSELKREIPEGWEVNDIGIVCDVIDCLHSKKPHFYENGRKFLLQLDNITDEGTIDISRKYYVTDDSYNEWTSRIEVTEGDLVITNAGRVGAFAQIPQGLTTGIGRNITAIRPIKVKPTYLFYYFGSIDIKRQIAQNTDVGAFFKSLNVRGIKQLKIITPVDNFINNFEAKARPIRKLIENNIKENQQLTELRDWLLPMLMNGQITVGEAAEKVALATEPENVYGR